VRPFLNLADPVDVQKMQHVAEELYEEVLKVGGTVSGEHGSGLSRTWFLRKQFGQLYDVFREVKRIFDPHHLLNPGKVIADVPQPLVKNLRSVRSSGMFAEASGLGTPPAFDSPAEAAAAEIKPLELHLVWNGRLAAEAAACNGCGRCRTQSPEARMCPIFRFAPAEEASPRAKANLMRAVIHGELDPAYLAKD